MNNKTENRVYQSRKENSLPKGQVVYEVFKDRTSKNDMAYVDPGKVIIIRF